MEVPHLFEAAPGFFIFVTALVMIVAFLGFFRAISKGRDRKFVEDKYVWLKVMHPIEWSTSHQLIYRMQKLTGTNRKFTAIFHTDMTGLENEACSEAIIFPVHQTESNGYIDKEKRYRRI